MHYDWTRGRVSALEFAAEWIAAWNAHDLARILSHYSDDIEMCSPFIAKMSRTPSGCLRGKAVVGAYWRAALDKIPDLRFELQEALVGASSLVIYYHAVYGLLAAETLFFNEQGKIFKAAAHYNELPPLKSS